MLFVVGGVRDARPKIASLESSLLENVGFLKAAPEQMELLLVRDAHPIYLWDGHFLTSKYTHTHSLRLSHTHIFLPHSNCLSQATILLWLPT